MWGLRFSRLRGRQCSSLRWHRLVKVKLIRYAPCKTLGVTGRIASLLLNLGIRTGWEVSITPRQHFTPEKEPPLPTYKSLGGPHSRLGAEDRKNLLPLSGIEHRSPRPELHVSLASCELVGKYAVVSALLWQHNGDANKHPCLEWDLNSRSLWPTPHSQRPLNYFTWSSNMNEWQRLDWVINPIRNNRHINCSVWLLLIRRHRIGCGTGDVALQGRIVDLP
jgi:hypothetical protein